MSVAQRQDAGRLRNGRVFVGRESELHELRTALEESAANRGTLFVLVGEPGIGKTRTCGELASNAEAADVRTYWGRCYEAGGAPAFWPWVQILRGIVRALDDEQLTAHLSTAGADLALLVPEVRERLPDLLPPSGADSEHARFRLFDAVATFLTRVARANPVVLLLDDMHAADEASLLLLQFLAKQLYEVPILAVATFRDVDHGRQHPVSRTLADLEREPACRRLHLARLDRTDVAAFIEGSLGVTPSDALVESVLASTEGNPFFLVEVVRLLGHDAARDTEDDEPISIAVPRGVRDVVGRRLDLLSDDSNRVLDAASVVGREFPIGVLEHLVETTREQLLEALEEARAARIIDEIPEAAAYRFSHALIREVLYEELTPLRRMRLHRSAAEAIEASSRGNVEPHLSELAYHFLAAASDGCAEKAVEYARRAGDHAMSVLAYEEAASAYSQALDALEFTSALDEHARGDLIIRLGEACAASGDADGARDAFLRAAALARRLGTPTLLGRAALGFAGSWTMYDRDVRDVELLREALAAIADTDDALRSRVLARIAADPDFPPSDERRAMADEAVELARRSSDLGALAFALKAKHGVIDSPSATQECLDVANEIIDVAGRAGDKEMVLLGRTLRASNLLVLGDFRAADREMEAHGMMSNELRQPLHQWLAALYRACRAISDGRFHEAEELSETALAIGTGSQATDVPEHYAIQLMVIRREIGGLEELVPIARQWVDERPQVPSWRAALAALLCEVEMYADARHELERLSPIEGTLPWDGNWLVGMATLAWTCAAVGDAGRAQVVYDALLPFAELNVIAGTVAVSFGPVAHYLGLLARTLGMRAEATRHFEESCVAGERTGGRAWLCWTLYEFARLKLDSSDASDRKDAARLLRDCVSRTTGLGMTRLTALSGELLRGLGSAEPRMDRSRVSLTPRELEVLRLIARGLSNREIARTLSASEKTVRNHVSSVLAKLHVADRTQAALYAVREGLADLPSAP